MRKQVPKTPLVEDCFCGAQAKLIDWDFRDAWRVMCDKSHTLTGEFVTRHRAVCRWNNEVEKRLKEMNDDINYIAAPDDFNDERKKKIALSINNSLMAIEEHAHDLELDNTQIKTAYAALKEENERLKMENTQINAAFQGAAKLYQETLFEGEKIKARVAELEGMYKPVYSVATGRVDEYLNPLYSITDKPIPMADNFILYRKEPANEVGEI